MYEAALVKALTEAIADTRERVARPVLIGISGVQGSGKSTLCTQLEAALAQRGLGAGTLSLDDLYLTRAERAALAASVHPLYATRGVPGTHDVALADRVISALLTGPGPVAIPRFDKARDDRLPERLWSAAEAPLDVLLFEGWCIAATPEPKSALQIPVNALEACEDPDLAWRSHVNDTLGADYARLFLRLDRLIMLRAPHFETVRGWRHEQEAGLKARAGADAGMDAAALDRFIAHFERLSRHMLEARPPAGAIVVALDEERRVCAVSGLPGYLPQPP
jgi:D-glycerate 3-kinase